MHIEINTDTLTTAGATKLAKQLSRIADLNDKRNEAVRAIEPIDAVPAAPKRGRKPRAAKVAKPVRAPRRAKADKPAIVSPGPAPRKTRVRRSDKAAGEPTTAPVAPNPVTGRTRKEHKPRTTKERAPRVPKALQQEANIERVIESVTNFLTANPEGSNSEAICAATGLHLPIVKAVIKALGERISTTGVARGTKYTLKVEAEEAGAE